MIEHNTGRKFLTLILLLGAFLVPDRIAVAADKAEHGANPSEPSASQKDLEELKQLLIRARSPVKVLEIEMALTDRPSKGSKDAPITLVEFSDYECPHCRRYLITTMPLIKRDYIETGKVLYVARDFPVEMRHHHAFKAARAAHCASEQQQFWEMHDRLITHAKSLHLDVFAEHAAAIGLDAAAFDQCLGSSRYVPEIREEISQGKRLGVRGTPTFFLGFTRDDGNRMTAIRRIVGAQPYDTFRQEMDKLLAGESLGREDHAGR